MRIWIRYIREEDRIFLSFSVCHSLSLDHVDVMCYLDVAKPPHRPVFQTIRNLRNIGRTHFCADVVAFVSSHPPATVDELDLQLRSVRDVHVVRLSVR